MKSKILLGTVQLGLDYGINNTLGKPNQDKANEILAATFQQGINTLDTAEAYGNAIEVIGNYHQSVSHKFDVISKLNARENWNNASDFENYFIANLEKLQVSTLSGYLFHNFDTYLSFNYWDSLLRLKKTGKINKIGVSIYNNEQAKVVANDRRIEIVQLPFNLLDNNYQRGEILQLLKREGKEIHVRSVFLQGLFFLKKEHFLPKLECFWHYISHLNELALQYKCTIGLMALAYNLKQPLIDKVLIGVDNVQHLQENLFLISQISQIEESLLNEIDNIQVKEIELLNPSNWV